MMKLRRQNSMEILRNFKSIENIFISKHPNTQSVIPEKAPPLPTDQQQKGSLFPQLFGLPEVQKKEPETPPIQSSSKQIIPSNSRRRRGSHRNLSSGPSQPSLLLADFNSKIKKMDFIAPLSGSYRMNITSEPYILDDPLNRDKFFVAFKFTDNQRKVWGRTRISLNCEVIGDAQMYNRMKEWVVLKKTLETALYPIEIPVRIPNSSVPENSLVPEFGKLQKEEKDAKSILASFVLKLFIHKFCITTKINGTSISYLTNANRKLFWLKNYFKDKYGKKVIQQKKMYIKLTPVPWVFLQHMEVEYVKEDDNSTPDPTFDTYYDMLFRIGNR